MLAAMSTMMSISMPFLPKRPSRESQVYPAGRAPRTQVSLPELTPDDAMLSHKDFWKHCIWQTKRSGWINDIIEDVVARGLGPAVHTGARRFSQYARLPPMEDVLSLVGDFFAGCNNILPLYHEETFMKQLYDNIAAPSESAGWWVSISTVLALGHISRMRSTFFPQEQERQAWEYMKNAMAIQSDFPTLDFDLLSVQALIGMVLSLTSMTPSSHANVCIAGALLPNHVLQFSYGFNDAFDGDKSRTGHRSSHQPG